MNFVTTEAVLELSKKQKSSIDGLRTARKPVSESSQIDYVLKLQNSIGNRAVQKLISSIHTQAKLKINQSRDIYEQEADSIAENIAKPPKPKLFKNEISQANHTSLIGIPLLQRQKKNSKEKPPKKKGTTTPEITGKKESQRTEQYETKSMTFERTKIEEASSLKLLGATHYDNP